MNERRLDLARRQGALRARIADQRDQLAAYSRPLEMTLGLADRGLDGLDWARKNPLAVGGAVFLLALLRPKRTWNWAKRGFVVWRGWQGLKNLLVRAG